VHRGRVDPSAQAFAQLTIGEHFRNLGEELQVLIRGLRRDEQNEHFAHRLVVRRSELDRGFGAQETCDRERESCDARMRNRDSEAEAGGSDLFALDKARVDIGLDQSVSPGNKARDFPQGAPLGRSIDVEQNVRRSQY